MPTFTATAPGKIILFGEHAVVYGHPALAVPVTKVCAKATITGESQAKVPEMRVVAPDIGLDAPLSGLKPGNPAREVIKSVFATLGVTQIPPCTLTVTSTIPIASGLGSGAAISAAIIRALSAFLKHPLPNEQVSALAYEIEKIHHGTPSGIDNTVIAFEKPVYFVKPLPSLNGRGTGGEGPAIQTFSIPQPFTILIGNTGISSLTKETVGDVRQAWQANPKRYQRIFAAVGSIAKAARHAIESGHPARLGPLMDENHYFLQEMGVSSPELDRLVNAARQAGALGAKLSGGGRGGNMIALAEKPQADAVAQAMLKAGAMGIIITQVGE